jgi:hypothetical protein
MSATQLVILVVLFTLLYKFVMPRLFPSVVSGSLTVDHAMIAARRLKKGGPVKAGDEPQDSTAPMDAFVVSGGGIGFVNNHRTQAKAQLRRRQADEGKNNAV